MDERRRYRGNCWGISRFFSVSPWESGRSSASDRDDDPVGDRRGRVPRTNVGDERCRRVWDVNSYVDTVLCLGRGGSFLWGVALYRFESTSGWRRRYGIVGWRNAGVYSRDRVDSHSRTSQPAGDRWYRPRHRGCGDRIVEVANRNVLSGSLFGLLTALSFSVSPIFVRLGMEEGASAEIGLTVGLTAAAVSWVVVMSIFDRAALDVRRLRGSRPVLWETAAAATIVTGTWLRYLAMALIPLAIVSAVGRVNILVILLLSRRTTTLRLWIGGALIIAGTALFSFG